MRLSDAVVENMSIGSVTYTSIKPFLDALCRARNIIVDVFVNTKLLFSSNVSFSVNHNELFASIDGRFSLDSQTDVSSLLARFHEAGSDIVIASSNTVMQGLSFEACDYDVDMFIKFGSTVPNNTSIKRWTPDTLFHSLGTNLCSKVDLSTQPSANPQEIIVEETTLDNSDDSSNLESNETT